MQYYDWGDPANRRVVICVHGLTRNGRDFDFLAEALSRRFRVVCPDIAGRGKSDWLRSEHDYSYVQYMSDLTALMDRVSAGGETTIHWVGTSMGALVGILLAALPQTPIRKLVVNDAGSRVPKAALQRLARYVGKEQCFESFDELEAHLRRVSAPFGPLSDKEWRHLALHSAAERDDGTWGMRYDPAIGLPFDGPLQDIDLSSQWDAITCPTLVLRGVESDLLLKETAVAMTQRGPKATLVEFDGVGHAPMLMREDQVCVVRDFLETRS
jgi:pimeloyl-ACP methyl ester carboxylesterase